MNLLAVNVTPRKRVYVDFTPDTHPNKGGYFCEVYLDPDKEFKYDEFTIQANLLRNTTEREKLARSVANEKVKSLFGKA